MGYISQLLIQYIDKSTCQLLFHFETQAQIELNGEHYVYQQLTTAVANVASNNNQYSIHCMAWPIESSTILPCNRSQFMNVIKSKSGQQIHHKVLI